MADANEQFTAPAILALAADAMRDRAAARDTPAGERSMARCVAMFNAYMGGDRFMSETDGWMFMVFLKAARSKQGDLNIDDYIDGAAYNGLAGESASREAQKSHPEAPTDTGAHAVGWIEWHGVGVVPRGHVEVMLRDNTCSVGHSRDFAWSHDSSLLDVVRYRFVADPRHG